MRIVSRVICKVGLVGSEAEAEQSCDAIRVRWGMNLKQYGCVMEIVFDVWCRWWQSEWSNFMVSACSQKSSQVESDNKHESINAYINKRDVPAIGIALGVVS